VRRDGTDVSIDDSAAPIRDAAGKLHGAVLVFRDVTQEKQEEARRAFLSRAGEELMEAADYRDALATVARLAVPHLADWVGVDVLEGDDPIPRQLAVAHVDPAKVAYARELRRRYPPRQDDATGIVSVIRSGRSQIVPDITPEVLDRVARDEEHRAIIQKLHIRSAMIVPLRGRDRVFGAISFVYAESGRRYGEGDLVLAEELARRAALVVERHRLEEERAHLLERERAARQGAELANRSKDEFLAIVSHELRNPLSVILGRTQLLLRQPPEELKKHLLTIERNARAQARLIEDVLDLSRIISGKLRLELQRTDVAEAVVDAVSTSRGLAEAKGVELSVAVEPGLELLADPVRLQQIVSNLASNAVKFTPAGGKVRVEGQRLDSLVRLTVRDTGEGIEPSMLSAIFEPFRQADASTTRRHGGLGLGLTIVRQLVHAHGGEVHAESAGRGAGATFVIDLPRRVGPGEREGRSVGAGKEASAPLRGVRVLAVDDQADALELVRDVLAAAEAEVETASSAAEAAEKLQRFPAQVLVTDIGMPGEDGFQLLRRLRRDPVAATARLPAVALTAYARPEDTEQARAAGFEAHLPKPVDAEQLLQTVARLVSQARSGPASPPPAVR
jgi:signal transduction histidine kinase/ActR/RegA family two-component response regulator